MPKMENLEGNTAEVLALPQGTSTQPGSAGNANQTDGGLIAQMHALFGKNAENMDRIAKLNTVQTDLRIAKIENQIASNNEQIKDQMVNNSNQINEKNGEHWWKIEQ